MKLPHLHRLSASAVLALGLAACASAPEATVAGALKPGAFAFASGDPAEVSAAQALIAERFAASGLRPAPAESADYIVQVATSRLSGRSGILLPDPSAPTAPTEDWRVKTGRGMAARLDVVVLDKATGQAVFQGAATARGRRAASPKALPRLVDAALGARAAR